MPLPSLLSFLSSVPSNYPRLSIDMLGISAALAVYVEPRKHLLPLGVSFIILTWTILTIRFINLLHGGAEGQGVPALNATDEAAAGGDSLLDAIINATVPFLGNATAS